MKTNIIHTLIVAIILVAGWSLFTVFQDISSSKSDARNGYNVIAKSRQYLPKAPESNSRNTNFPVYRAPNRTGTSINNINSRQQVAVSQNPSFEIASSSQHGMTGGLIARDRAVVASRRQNENTNVDFRRPNFMSPNVATPFSNNMRVNPERNIADASLSSGNISGSNLSGGNAPVIMKAFGWDDEGDDFEMGGGTENQNFYNDVPVGEGLLAFLLFGLIYAFVKFRIGT